MTFTLNDLKAALRNGPYAWPGGYPCFFITHDGEAMSHESVKRNLRQIMQSIHTHENDGWRIVGHDVNWEDPHMVCVHSNERIPSAYGDD